MNGYMNTCCRFMDKDIIIYAPVDTQFSTIYPKLHVVLAFQKPMKKITIKNDEYKIKRNLINFKF